MKWAGRGKLNRSTLICVGLAAFLVGLVLARSKSVFGLLILLIPIIALAFKKIRFLILIISLSFAFGWWRGSSYLKLVNKYQPLYFQKVTIIGQADTEGIYDKGSQLAFDLKDIKVTEPYQAKLVGKIGIKGFGVPMVYRGDVVRIAGKMYPTRGSKQASISYSKIELLNHHTSVLESIRHRFVTGMYNALPEPLASFGLGLLIGQRNTLPENVSQQLSTVGLTHVIAVSGYNLTIIMTAVAYGLRNRSKYQASLISAILIGLFLLFTGFSASIVRASIVSMLSIVAAFYGRNFKPTLLILLTAALTAGFYPIYIWSDVGWYLSFLAFFGVLVIAPQVLKRISKQKQPKLLALVMVETVAAQIMALPLIMYIFGEVSIVAIPANILVVPFVPLAMLLSFVAALAGTFTTAVAGWLAWPTRLLLTYMLDVVALMSKIPHALVINSLSLTQLVFIYGLILVLLFLLLSKTKPKNATITDIFSEEL